MGNFLVRKANGLYGEVNVQSAKNALLPIISACALIEAPVTIKNVSMMSDVEVMLDVLCALGAKYRYDGYNLTVDCRSLYKNELPEELTRKIRSSVFGTSYRAVQKSNSRKIGRMQYRQAAYRHTHKRA